MPTLEAALVGGLEMPTGALAAVAFAATTAAAERPCASPRPSSARCELLCGPYGSEAAAHTLRVNALNAAFEKKCRKNCEFLR